MIGKICRVFVIFLVAISMPVWAGGDAVKDYRQQEKEEITEYLKQQMQEAKAFSESLKGMPAAEKKKVIIAHREAQYEKGRLLRRQKHEEYMVLLKERLAKNDKLTQDEKNAIISFFESQYKEDMEFLDKQHVENMAFFEQITRDTKMIRAARREAIRDYFKKQKEENREHSRIQLAENKAETEKIRSEIEVKTEKGSGTRRGGG